MRWQLWHLVSSQSKKPQGPVTLLEVTHLACLYSLSRSQVGLRGPWALGHVFGKRFWLRDINTGIVTYIFESTVRDASKRNIRCVRLSRRFGYLKLVAFAERFAFA